MFVTIQVQKKKLWNIVFMLGICQTLGLRLIPHLIGWICTPRGSTYLLEEIITTRSLCLLTLSTKGECEILMDWNTHDENASPQIHFMYQFCKELGGRKKVGRDEVCVFPTSIQYASWLTFQIIVVFWWTFCPIAQWWTLAS